MAETKKVSKENSKARKELDYFGILKNAFGMVRHNRYLWYLGILAGSAGSGVNFPGGFGDYPSNSGEQKDIDFNQVWSGVIQWLQIYWIVVAIIVLLIITLIVVCTLLSNMSKAGLVHAVDSLSKNEENSFGKAMKFGWHKWWKVFGAGFLIGLAVFGLFLIIAVPVVVFWFVNPILGILVTMLALPIFIFIAILSGIVFEYTLRYIVLKEYKAVTSIKKGFGLMKSAKKETLFIWLVTVGVAMVAGIIVLMAILLVGLILVLLGILFFLLSVVAGIIYTGIALIACIIVLFTVGGFISSFMSAYWTLCFKELET